MFRPTIALIGVFTTLTTALLLITVALGPSLPSGDVLMTASWRVTLSDTQYLFTVTDLDRDITVERPLEGGGSNLAFSPTGERVMIPQGDGISVIDMQSGDFIRTPSTASPQLIGSGWSSDGNRYMMIAGEQALNLNPNISTDIPEASILVLDVDSQQTTTLEETALTARFSPAGTHVMLIADDELVIAEVDTGDTWTATTREETARFQNFIWSPGGAYLAFSRSLDAETDLLLLDIATREITNLTADITERVESVHWSPAGTHIALIAGLLGERVLYLIDVTDGTTEQIVTTAEIPQLWDVIWSPDNRNFAIQTGIETRVDNGIEATQVHAYYDGALTLVTAFADDALWSADGRYLLYRTSQPTARLGLLDLQTGARQHIETRGGASLVHAAWGSNTNQVLFNEFGGIFRWDLRTNTVEDISPHPFGIILYTVYD